VRRQTIAMIWIGGLLLALGLYVTGPDRFLDAALSLFGSIDYWFHDLIYQFGIRAFHVIRALAIALYIVFLVLGFLAVQRGIRAWGTLIVVSVIFLALVWRPEAINPLPPGRWLAALVIALFGALVMTHRLTSPPGPKQDWPPDERWNGRWRGRWGQGPGTPPPGWTPPPGPPAGPPPSGRP
jgi:hypothetical protein